MEYLLESVRLEQSRQEKNSSSGTSAAGAYSTTTNIIQNLIFPFYFPFRLIMYGKQNLIKLTLRQEATS